MASKQHGGKREGAGKPACKVDRLAALHWADEYAVTPGHARIMLREDGPELLSPAKWRAIGIIVECGEGDDEALRILKTIK
jgi:hypothetical protein